MFFQNKEVMLLMAINVLLMAVCCSRTHNGIQDLIPTIYLKANVPDTIYISDLFYTENNEIDFKPNRAVFVNLSKSKEKVVIKADSTAEGLTLLDFSYQGESYSLPLRTQVLQTYRFSYSPAKRPDKVTLFGSFNSWNRDNLPMYDEDGDGLYEAEIALEPGRYEYKFFVDGAELLDTANPQKVSNPFGSFNSVLTVPPRHPYRGYLHLIGYQKTLTGYEFSFYYEDKQKGNKLEEDVIIALLDNVKIPVEKIKVRGDYLLIHISDDLMENKSLIRVAVNKKGISTRFQTVFLPSILLRDDHTKVFSRYDAIFYSIMIDRFHDGNPQNNQVVVHPEVLPKANFHGGDLQGILEKLMNGYFQNLGINVLWLSPVNQNTWGAFQEYPEPHRYSTGYHGYWPIHHQIVDKRFGDLDLFKKLIETAHNQNIKVILDFVAHHVHQEHPFYINHPEWFGQLELPDGRQNLRMWDEYRLTTWFDRFLPSFDYQGSNEALETMTDNAIWWLKETKIDGFRQDAVKHIPNEFWRTLTAKIKKEIELKKQHKIFQIGETFGSYELISSYVNNGQLNSQFNFNLYDAALYVFLNSEESFSVLDGEIDKTFEIYGTNHLMGNLMDSHDKVRFMAYADGDLFLDSNDATETGWNNPPVVDDSLSYQKAILFLAYMMTIPGIPVLYYGDEIGMTGAADPDNRRPMRFDSDLNKYEKEMLLKVREIIQFRKQHSALRYGDFLTLQADKNIYAYLRSDPQQRIIILLNKSGNNQNVSINLPDIYQLRQAINLRKDQRISLEDSRLQLLVKARDYAIFQLH
jgi:cyclomaltodextrinase